MKKLTLIAACITLAGSVIAAPITGKDAVTNPDTRV